MQKSTTLVDTLSAKSPLALPKDINPHTILRHIRHGVFNLSAAGKTVSLIPTDTLTKTDRTLHIINHIKKAINSVAAPVTQPPQDPFYAEKATIISFASALGNNQDADAIVQFCTAKMQQAMQDGSLSAITLARQSIAKIIFTADRDLETVVKMLNLQDIAASEKQITALCNTMIAALKNNSVSTLNKIEKAGIQDKNVAASILLPAVVAFTMVTSTGTLNLAAGSLIAQALFAGNESTDYAADVHRVIDALNQSQDLQMRLSQVVKPSSSDLYSNIVIRSTLSLDHPVPISDAHAKAAALAALMTNLRQGPVGSCFATFCGIELLALRLDKAGDDFMNILRNDALSRMVDGEKKKFEYVLDISDDDITAVWTLSKNGTIKETGINILDCHGLERALNQMGAQNNECVKTAISNLLKSDDEMKASFSDIIKEISSVINGKPSDDLFQIGKIAFSSVTNNPLLRAWESCIASMAEARPQDQVRGQILNCLQAALMPQLQAKKPQEIALNKKIQNVFLDTLNNNMSVRFDTSVASASVASDGHSTEGAFVPFEETSTTTSATGKRIDTPQKFSAFVWNQLKITNETLQHQTSNPQEQTAITKTIQKIQNYVKTNSNFLTLALTNYDSENKKIKDPLKNWAQLEHTPFGDKTGDDDLEVLKIYFETRQPLQPISYTPKNPTDLLRFIIQFLRNEQATTGYLDKEPANYLLHCSTPTHAFSIEAFDPSLVDAVRDTGDIDTWITNNLVDPGNEVADSILGRDAQGLIIDYVCQNLVAPDLEGTVRAAAKKMAPDLTVLQVRSKVLEIIHQATNSTKHLDVIAKYLDVFIVGQALPNELKKKLRIIGFCDTNWNDGDKNILFCNYFNPCDGTIDFGMTDDDNSKLMYASSSEWVEGQEWDLLPVSIDKIG